MTLARTPREHGVHRDLIERMVTEQPDRLRNKMLPRVRDRALAEDLSQETLTRALQSLATLRGPAVEALVCGWLDTIATNVLRAHARSVARRPQSVDLDDPSTTALIDPSSPVDQRLLDHETSVALAALVSELPESLAQVFVARVVDEQSTAQIAAALGVSREVVRARLHRARVALRQRIDLVSDPA